MDSFQERAEMGQDQTIFSHLGPIEEYVDAHTAKFTKVVFPRLVLSPFIAFADTVSVTPIVFNVGSRRSFLLLSKKECNV